MTNNGENNMADQEFEMSAKLQIRAAEAKDATDLHTYCLGETPVEEITAQLKEDVSRGRKGEVHRLVVDAGGHAVANIRVERNKGNPKSGEIGQLAVAAPFRAFGVADKLIDAVGKLAQEGGVKILQIELSNSDAAIIEAYKRWGFAERPVVTLEKSLDAAEAEASEEDEAPEPPPEKAEAYDDSDNGGEQQELL